VIVSRRVLDSVGTYDKSEFLDMANNISQWADAQLSKELPKIRAAGEGATVEFKERIPRR